MSQTLNGVCVCVCATVVDKVTGDRVLLGVAERGLAPAASLQKNMQDH